MADKKLNSLERFRKQSPRLVLEEHSHCEVPAGCGGVVLRWRNPLAGLPLLVHFYAPGKSTLYLDGREVTQIGNDLPPGPPEAAGATRAYLNNRKLSIYGGSNEIQRGIIAKSLLGL